MFLGPGNSLEKALNFVLVEVYEPWVLFLVSAPFSFLVSVPFSFLVLVPFSFLVLVPFLVSFRSLFWCRYRSRSWFWYRSCSCFWYRSSVLYFLFLLPWYCSAVPGNGSRSICTNLSYAKVIYITKHYAT